jgi:DNA-binding SARP family transcriptional activator/tetratricopeptide (TPR) repeat protein
VDVTRSVEPSHGVQFKILGPIEVLSGDTPVRIPPGRQPIILSALLLEPNRVVSIDRLIDVVWDEKPPATARSQVQICVSALRHVFAELGVESPIVTKPPGYLLKVTDGQLDSQMFTHLVAEAAEAERDGQLAEAAALLRRAMSLWRGPALGGDPGPALSNVAVRLEEARLNALESCVDLELKLGRHQLVIGELSSLVAEYPLKERLRGQLMVALYRAGRPAEALEVYRAGWRILVDELGMEPSEELRNLEAAILNEDPALQQPEQPQPMNREVRPQVGPRQLPADTVDFTGREDLVEQAEAALLDEGEAVRVVVFAGKAGIGKTALAVHVAHRIAERRFPDGQLFAILAGTPRKPADPSDVLGRFLRALGIPGSAIPDELDERAEMYRSLLAGRRLLVVLDDVAAVRQVTPLLPGSGSCAVVLTSRMRLTEIPGARVLDVDLLQTDKSLNLLGKVIGEQRVAGESTAAEALVRMVGGLPLALRIVAARLAARPHWSLASMVGRLADERRRLDELAHGDMMMRASLQLTYEGLEPRVAQLFRLLGALPNESIPSWVAAALLDEDVMEAAGLLERLVDMQLLDVTGPDLDGQPRYGFHAIIRLFARDRLAGEDQEARNQAVARVLGGWLARAEQVHQDLYGGPFSVLQGKAFRWRPTDGGSIGLVAVDPLHWLEAESVNLVAAVGQAADEGLDEMCWELAEHLVILFETGSYYDDWQHTHERALDAARRAGNRRGEAVMLCSLGSLYLARRRLSSARAVLEPAQTLFTQLGDIHGQAMTNRNLALLDHHNGETDRAMQRYLAALEGFRRTGDLGSQAHALSNMARISADQGDYEQATEQLSVALDICREVGNRRVESQVLYRLGETLLLQRRLQEAELVLGTVLELVRSSHDVVGEGYVLHALGVVRASLGRRDEAKELLETAIGLREQIMDHVGAARINLDLAPLLADQGEEVEAVQMENRARRLLRSLTDRSLIDPAHVRT